jgi:DHA2 family multidrug resistance protein
VAQGTVIGGGPIATGSISHRPFFAVCAVLMGAFVANLDTRLFSVALPDLRGALGLSFDEGAWLSTASTASQIFIAPAVAWMATAFGLRRVLGIPSLVYALISLLIPFIRDYNTLLMLTTVHGMLLGTFVPATLLIAFRNLPMKWWLPAIAIYSIRVGLTLNFSFSLVGFYVDQAGWQWLFWQDVIIAPLMGLFVYLGTPHESVSKAVVEGADWGGMLLLGTGMAMIYSGLDQGNRLDWFGSGTVVALLCGGAVLTVIFLINEALVPRPWAHAEVILSRNIGLALVVILLYSLTSLSNSLLAPNFLTSITLLRPEQSGPLFLVYAVLPMVLLVPLSLYFIQHHDPRWILIAGLSAFAGASLLGTRLTHDWSLDDFVPMVLLQSVGHSFALLPIVVIALSNSDPSRATAFAAYIQVVRLGGAEIGVALMGSWLRVCEQMQSNLLGLHITRGDSDVAHVLVQLASHFTSHGEAAARARGVGILAELVQREATTLAFINGFWLTAWFAIAGLIVVAFIGPAPSGPFSPTKD